MILSARATGFLEISVTRVTSAKCSRDVRP